MVTALIRIERMGCLDAMGRWIAVACSQKRVEAAMCRGLAAYFKLVKVATGRAYRSPDGGLVVTACAARAALNQEKTLRGFFSAFRDLLFPHVGRSHRRPPAPYRLQPRLPPAALRHYARQRAARAW